MLDPVTAGSQALHEPIDYYERFHAVPDEDWWALWPAYAADPASRDDLPAFPSAEVQQRLHGTTFARAMTGALGIRLFTLRFVRQVLHTHVVPEMKVLDFGCGWGRVMRVLLKDIHTHNLHGTDIDEEVIALAREMLPAANFAVNDRLAPLDYDDASFDIVIVNSVFSHLAEPNFLFWLGELTRVLKPGRALVFTSWGRGLLEMAKPVFATGVPTLPWQRNLLNGFASFDQLAGRFGAGHFVFAGTGGGPRLPPEDFGIAMVPRAYFEALAPRLGLIATDFLDDPEQFSQSVFFAQKDPRA
jgi:SAM-dependent methyltransferase